MKSTNFRYIILLIGLSTLGIILFQLNWPKTNRSLLTYVICEYTPKYLIAEMRNMVTTFYAIGHLHQSNLFIDFFEIFRAPV